MIEQLLIGYPISSSEHLQQTISHTRGDMLNPNIRLVNSIIHPAESRPFFHKPPALRVLLDFDDFSQM